MATLAPEAIKELSAEWAKIYKSAKPSGIVGDTAHKARGGYHISREDQPNNNYSVVRPDDKVGPSNTATAVDMNLSPADMKTCTTRLVSAYNNTSDPRRKYINAFNGSTDGKAARRWDVYARATKSATADHLWHVHLEVRRRYCTSSTAVKAILSILRGDTVATYLNSIGVARSVAASPQSSTAAASAPPFPGVLKRNDSQASPNLSVKAFQAQLLKRGWVSLGTADGFFGANLEATLKKWQSSIGLTADGVIGPKTWPTPWTRPVAK